MTSAQRHRRLRQRVAHLRHGLLPVTEAAAKKGVRHPITSPDDEAEKHFQGELQLEASGRCADYMAQAPKGI